MDNTNLYSVSMIPPIREYLNFQNVLKEETLRVGYNARIYIV